MLLQEDNSIERLVNERIINTGVTIRLVTNISDKKQAIDLAQKMGILDQTSRNSENCVMSRAYFK
jgi:hypothetical protein